MSDSAERLWPLACLAALPAAVSLDAVRGRWLEGASGRGRRVRAGGLVAVAGLVVVGALAGWLLTVVTSDDPSDAAAVVRNFAAVAGLTLVAARSRMAEVAWAPGLVAVVACWLFGSAPVGADPARWALLLLPAGDLVALVPCVALALAGTVAYTRA